MEKNTNIRKNQTYIFMKHDITKTNTIALAYQPCHKTKNTKIEYEHKYNWYPTTITIHIKKTHKTIA